MDSNDLFVVPHKFNSSQYKHQDMFLKMDVTEMKIPSTSAFMSGTSEVEEVLKNTRFVVQKVIIPIVVLFGVTGNAINIVVLSKRWMKSSTNCYLSALAVFDALYLLFATTMTFTHYDYFKDSLVYKKYHWPYGRPLTDVFSNTGVWLTVTFTVERYIGVQFPIKGRIWCTCERARKCVLAVFVIASLLTLPEFLEKRAVERFDEGLNKSVVVIEDAATWLKGISYYNFNQVMFTFLPLTLLMVFNGLLIRTVMLAARLRSVMTNQSLNSNSNSKQLITAGHHQQQQQQQQQQQKLQLQQHYRCSGALMPEKSQVRFKPAKVDRQHQNRDQQKITIMLIVVVIVFLVCQLPQAIQKLFEVYLEKKEVEKRGHVKTTLTITANYFNLLVMVNASINFILYSSLSVKFRRTFLHLYCRCIRRSSSGGMKIHRRLSNANISLKNPHNATNDTNCTMLPLKPRTAVDTLTKSDTRGMFREVR